MSRIDEFDEARPLLYALARRMLGSASEAEDAVHQAWLRYEAAPEQVCGGREFLTGEVIRICVGVLRADTGRHLGPLPPDPLLRDLGPAEALSTAALLFLERLSPLERAVFVLREVFGCDVAEVADAVGCSEAACRQLAATVSQIGDGGGTAPPWPQRIAGAEHVARVLAAIVPALLRIGVTMEPEQVGHRPGAVFRDRRGQVLSALALDIHGGRIHTISWVLDPHQPTSI